MGFLAVQQQCWGSARLSATAEQHPYSSRRLPCVSRLVLETEKKQVHLLPPPPRRSHSTREGCVRAAAGIPGSPCGKPSRHRDPGHRKGNPGFRTSRSTLSMGNDTTRRLLTSGVSLLAAQATVLGVASSAGGETAFRLTTAQSSVDVKHLLPILLELITPYPWCLCLTALHCSEELQEHPEAVIPSRGSRVISGKARESSGMETASSQHQEFFESLAHLGHMLASPWVFLWVSECCRLAGLRVPR